MISVNSFPVLSFDHWVLYGMSISFNPHSVFGLRQSLDMSQNQFANLLGCTPESVRNWEKGRSTPAGHYIDGMHRLCRDKGFEPPSFYGDRLR